MHRKRADAARLDNSRTPPWAHHSKLIFAPGKCLDHDDGANFPFGAVHRNALLWFAPPQALAVPENHNPAALWHGGGSREQNRALNRLVFFLVHFGGICGVLEWHFRLFLVELHTESQLKGFPGALLLLSDFGVGLSAATLVLGLIWGFIVEGSLS
jgi:hypothetical protein